MEVAQKKVAVRGEQVQALVMGVVAVGVMVLVLGVGSEAWAAGTGMPWENTLNKILASLQGPVARFVGVVAIVVAGLSAALGESGGMFKQGASIVFGLSIAFSAATFITEFGFAGGALF